MVTLFIHCIPVDGIISLAGLLVNLVVLKKYESYRLIEGKKNYEHQRIEHEEMSEKNRDLQRNLDIFQLSVHELERRYICASTF